jgi:cephalosporin-C deacetylase
MRRLTIALALVLCACAASVAQQAPPAVTIAVTTGRPDAMYKRGETVTFSVTAKQGDQALTSGAFSYALSLDGGKQLGDGQGQFGPEPFKITGTLDQPGVLRCAVYYRQDDKSYSGLGGAAFDPLGIRPSADEPTDFVSWWDAQKALVRAIPADVQLTKNEQASNERATYYKISIANVEGKRVRGWLGVPNRQGRFPAVLTVPAAGVYTIPPGWAALAERGFLALGIIIHDFEVDLPADQLTEVAKSLEGYAYRGRESRDTCYFRAAFLGCVRAMDYLCGRPEWNGKDLIVNGSSQGGGLSLVCAGLDPRVNAIASNVPALCDHLGYQTGHQAGWPALVPVGEANADTVAAAAPYFDAVNFARHARCEAVVAGGLIDTTCPATGVYAAFSVLPEPKQMVTTPTQGHAYSAEYTAARDALIARYAPPGP